MIVKLPDVLGPGLKVVFCGTAAGDRSAERGCYYAGPGNRFWSTLAEVGLTAKRYRPEEFRQLAHNKLGLTDLAKTVSGSDSSLRKGDFDVQGLRKKLVEAAPKFVAFNGKKPAAVFLGQNTENLPYGPLAIRIGEAQVFVLPSTSARATKYWAIEPWANLAKLV